MTRLPPDCPIPVRLTVPLAVSEANAKRAFWRGIVIGGLIIGTTFIGSAWL